MSRTDFRRRVLLQRLAERGAGERTESGQFLGSGFSTVEIAGVEVADELSNAF